MPVGIDFGVKKVYKSPKSIHRADAKGLTSSSKLSVSCVLTLQTLPLITFTPLHLANLPNIVSPLIIFSIRRYDRLGRSMFTLGSPCYYFTDFQAEVVTR